MSIGINGELHERRRQVYVCEDNHLFLVTGTHGKVTGSRKAYIEIIPFYSLDPGGHETLLKEAEDYSEESSSIIISLDNMSRVSAYDKLCQTTSQLQLDQQRLDTWLEEKDRNKPDRPYLDKLRAQSREFVLKL